MGWGPHARDQARTGTGPPPGRSLLPVDLHVVLGAAAQGHTGLQQVEDFEDDFHIFVVGHLWTDMQPVSAPFFPPSQTQGHHVVARGLLGALLHFLLSDRAVTWDTARVVQVGCLEELLASEVTLLYQTLLY